MRRGWIGAVKLLSQLEPCRLNDEREPADDEPGAFAAALAREAVALVDSPSACAAAVKTRGPCATCSRSTMVTGMP